MRVVTAAAAIALSFAATLPAMSKDPVPVILSTGWILSGGSAPLTLANERGYFKQGGADVKVVRGFGSSDVVAKVAAGTYQAGTGFLPALVRAISENPGLDAIAVLISYDASADAVTGPKSSGIVKVTDLAGKKLSTQPNSTTKQLFEPFAKKAGIDPASIQWVEVAPDLIGVTVVRGQADGAGQFAATAIGNFERLGLKTEDMYQFKFSDYVDNLYSNGLILQKSWAQANPEAAKAVVRGYAKGLIDAYVSPDAAITSLVAQEPLLNKDVEARDLNYSNVNYYFTQNVKDKGVGYHTEADVKAFIDVIAKPLGLKRVPAPSEVFTSAYLPSPDELKVPKAK